MSPGEAKAIYYKVYAEGISWQSPEKPTVQLELQERCWQAVIDAVVSECDAETAKRLLPLIDGQRPIGSNY